MKLVTTLPYKNIKRGQCKISEPLLADFLSCCVRAAFWNCSVPRSSSPRSFLYAIFSARLDFPGWIRGGGKGGGGGGGGGGRAGAHN